MVNQYPSGQPELSVLKIKRNEHGLADRLWRNMTEMFAAVQQDRTEFEARFWRSYRLLRYIASRILREPKEVDQAIENCWRTASRHPQQFEHEGEFRSWLLRVLIDEALLLRNQQHTPAPA